MSLSPENKSQLKELAKQVKTKKNLTILLAGKSSTGKTQAAELLATSLDLPLYRVDLSLVISKYIGETEKNLQKVFNQAEEKGWILLFDEADALFGKRTEISDAHDRFSKGKGNLLLELLVKYGGPVILTSDTTDKFESTFLKKVKSVKIATPKPKKKKKREEK